MGYSTKCYFCRLCDFKLVDVTDSVSKDSTGEDLLLEDLLMGARAEARLARPCPACEKATPIIMKYHKNHVLLSSVLLL